VHDDAMWTHTKGLLKYEPCLWGESETRIVPVKFRLTSDEAMLDTDTADLADYPHFAAAFFAVVGIFGLDGILGLHAHPGSMLRSDVTTVEVSFTFAISLFTLLHVRPYRVRQARSSKSGGSSTDIEQTTAIPSAMNTA
jgi:hypothetical protein